MSRDYNTDSRGNGFSIEVRRAVWAKSQLAPGNVDGSVRVDVCGAHMNWSDYGQVIERGFGWEIDHINPVANGGSDDLSNLQALQWQNNRQKGDSTGQNYCKISYGGA